MNVALRLKSFGVNVELISAIGNDHFGDQILTSLNQRNIKTDIIGRNDYPTGVVNISINEKGNARYDIIYPSAWDKIIFSEKVSDIISKSKVFVFGSLVSRDPVSRESLMKYLSYAKYKVFDVNLRKPHFTHKGILELMNFSDLIKLNDEELFEISEALGSKNKSLKQNIIFLSKKTNTKTICVTKGAYGAVLFHNGNFFKNDGYKVSVIDTVGSGDSFLAALIFSLFSGNDPQEAVDRACAIGAIVAASEGANPTITPTMLNDFMLI